MNHGPSAPLSPPDSVASGDWSGATPQALPTIFASPSPFPPSFDRQAESPSKPQRTKSLRPRPILGLKLGMNMNGFPPHAGLPPGPGYGPGPPGNYRPLNSPTGPPPHGLLGGNPSPPSSVARSSSGTLVSAMHGDALQRRKVPIMEDVLAQHYGVLKRFLANATRDEQTLAAHKPNRARDKLIRLSPVQFQELSTDVYDELSRRQHNAQRVAPPPGGSPSLECLPPRENFHPKRNQARQKLSTLPPPRFRALATDVFFELERRVPRFAGMDIGRGGSPSGSPRSFGPPSRSGTPTGARPGSRDQMRRAPLNRQGSYGNPMLGLGVSDEYGKPLAKSSQSNTLVPNKSYLVEDEGDGASTMGAGEGDSLYGFNRRDTGATARSQAAHERTAAEYQGRLETLEKQLADVQNQLQDRQNHIDRLEVEARDHGSEKDSAARELSDVRVELEGKLAEAQTLNSDLRSELERVRDDHATRAEGLEAEVMRLQTSSQNDATAWRRKHDVLRDEHANLRDEHGSLRDTHQGLQQAHQALEKDHRDLHVQLTDLQLQADSKHQSVDTILTIQQNAEAALAEMKNLVELSDQHWKREQALQMRVRALETEVGVWRERAAHGVSERAVPMPQAGPGLVRPDGAIPRYHVTSFQQAVDATLEAAHHQGGLDEPLLIGSMRAVVAAVQRILEDVPAEGAKADASLLKIRKRIVATINNFITATRNHASSQGLSPVSLLDAAASHLATSIVALVAVVGAKTSNANSDHLPERSEDGEQLPARAMSVSATPRIPHVSMGSSQGTNGMDLDSHMSSQMPGRNSDASTASQLPGRYSSVYDGTGVGGPNHYPHPDDEDDSGALRVNGRYSSAYNSVYSSATFAAAGGVRDSTAPALPNALHSTPHTRQSSSSSFTQALTGSGGPNHFGNMGANPNGRSKGHARGVSYDLREANEEITELKHNLDTQAGALIDAIQLLVTSIRDTATPATISSNVTRLGGCIGAVLHTVDDATSTSSSHQQLPSRLPPPAAARLRRATSAPVAALASGKARLLAAEDSARDAAEEAEWREKARQWPPLAFEIGRAVRELVAQIEGLMMPAVVGEVDESALSSERGSVDERGRARGRAREHVRAATASSTGARSNPASSVAGRSLNASVSRTRHIRGIPPAFSSEDLLDHPPPEDEDRFD